MSHRYFLAVGLLVALGGCVDQPCDRYVTYMCDCHADDTGYDCAQLQDIYGQADPDVQDQCAIDLNNQKADDQAAGLECTTSA